MIAIIVRGTALGLISHIFMTLLLYICSGPGPAIPPLVFQHPTQQPKSKSGPNRTAPEELQDQHKCLL